MNKIIFIIPWFRQNTKIKWFVEIISFLKENNFEVIEVEITWNKKVMSDYLKEFLEIFYKTNAKWKEIYLLWFSFWAFISFLASNNVKIDWLFLCSLSPYFKEDLDKIPKTWKKYLWKNRVSNFENISFNEIVKKIECETFIFYWDKEPKRVWERAKKANQEIKNSKLIKIEWWFHDIWQEIYLEKVKNNLKASF